ncbi:MAG: class I SAM-dependent methyltransferase [Lewinella sp.]|nr:class I SAM-dependent methyltransferase [Lewinella sp.]
MAYDLNAFANRLAKMARHYDKWARRQGITCYRVYDADLPAFPLAIDRYENYVHVAEYQRRQPLSTEEYEQWHEDVMRTLVDQLEVAISRIYFKERRPQKGAEQYERLDDRSKEIEVQEAGLTFIVNLSDYLDTGLFLDHRPLRASVREEAAGKSVLNLFAYTGSFTVFAAAGQASRTLTIDLSNTYLEWAQRNLERNQLEGPKHEFLRADVKAWLKETPSEKFDIIILDPPTFSNSKAMRHLLDTQVDHPYLINACLRRLRPGGVLYFSTNYRKFKLETEAIRSPHIRDITAQTIPNDFRNKRIHYCWEIRR